MYKIIGLLLFVVVSLSATQTNQYYIKYKGITLGTIDDFTTIDKGYLIGKPVGGLLGAFVSFDHYIIHEPNIKPKLDGKSKYKLDKYMLLSIIRNLATTQPTHQLLTKDHYRLEINCKDSQCKYTRYNTLKNKSYSGHLNFQNGILEEICDDESSICFKLIQTNL
jgi:hypothetical protein